MSRPASVVLVLSLAASPLLADWPQWRGPARDGVAAKGPTIATTWPKLGPKLLWESESFPAKCGEGSVVVAAGRAYVFVNWQDHEPIVTRKLDRHVLKKLRWFEVGEMPAELLETMEKARLSIPEDLRGKKLDDWITAWVDRHVPEGDKKLKRLRSAVERRLKDGPDATPLDILAKLTPARDREYPTQAALEEWIDAQSIVDPWRAKILDNVVKTRPIARDIVFCFDATSGKTVWKRTFEGEAQSRDGSSTPAVVGDRVYVAGTKRACCLDAKTGDTRWSTEIPGGGAPSSFLVDDETAIVLAGELTAFDSQSGEVLWTQKDVRGRQSSPTRWRHGDRDLVLVNTDRKHVACVDAKSGYVLWTAPGGGSSTVVVSGDRMVVHSKDKERHLVGYAITKDGARELWSHSGDGRGAASPIISDDRVFLLGSDTFACYDLESGEERWQKKGRVEISSPVLVDGKLLSVTNNGGFLVLLEASSKGYEELAKARMRAARCPSPAVSRGKVFLRMRDRVACFDLTASGQGS
jgi:outer membrane protein assembly factor BamB